MERFTAISLVLALCLAGFPAPAGAEVGTQETASNKIIIMSIGSTDFTVDGTVNKIDVSPQITWGRTFAPVAPIVQALDGTVMWSPESRGVTIAVSDVTIVLTVDSHFAIVNGVSIAIDSNPYLVSYIQPPGITMLPVRFIAEQLGGIVMWNQTLQKVTLTLRLPQQIQSLSQRTVNFRPYESAETFLELLRDESIDIIQLNGTYRLPCLNIDIDRKRPVLVRPAPGATAVFSGTRVGLRSQFEFGCHGVAGNIAMEGLIFDGFLLGQQGIIYALDCHDITINDITVRNSRADAATAEPYQSWAVYLSSTATAHPSNFTANRWIVEGSARTISALQVYGGSHVTAVGWSVSNACLAVYGSSSRGPLTDFVIDDWTIENTGAMGWGTTNGVSVYVSGASGRFSNIRGVASGILVNVGMPQLTDGGGNSL